MVTTNYYGRVSESKRTQNLYGSDSGLDTAYNIIAKTVEAASIYSNYKVSELKEEVKSMDYNDYNAPDIDEDTKVLYALYADIEYWKNFNSNLKEDEQDRGMSDDEINDEIEADIEDIDNLINKIFRDKFKEFIIINLKTSVEDNEFIEFERENDALVEYTRTVDKDKYKAEVYVGKKSTKGVTSEYNDVILKQITNEEVKLSGKLKVEMGYEDDGTIKYDNYPSETSNYEIKFNNNEEYKVILTSEFKTDANSENTAKVGENQRVIEADYSIRVPNYNEVAFKESIVDKDESLKDIVGLTVGGDMKVTDVNKLNVTGDIFVEGRENNVTDSFNGNRTYEKYSGGVILDNSSGNKVINFNNNIYTRGSFNIKNNVDVSVKGDLYAKNIYAGDENDVSENSVLTVEKEAVVDNDLTVKAFNTAINLTDFYGINDKYFGDEEKYKKSSSIIINDYKDSRSGRQPSTVAISNEAYIMGVAHINTESGYQTGESVAVKRNYNAYSTPIDGSESFIDDNPLRLLDESLLNKKAEHFWEFWKDKTTGTNSVDCGGVILNKDKTYSIGALVYEEIDVNTGEKIKNVERELKFVSEDVATDKIKSKRSDYAKYVFNIGTNNLSRDELFEQYNTNLTEVDVQTVSNLLNNMSQLRDSDYQYKTNRMYNNSGEKVAIIGQEGKTIVFEGKGCLNNYSGDDYVIIDATSNKNVNAVIVTQGNVIIDGEVNIRGNIIAQGDLTILGNSTVNIFYDRNITEEIQKQHGELFTTIFGSEFGGQVLTNNNLEIASNTNNFIKSNLWRLIQ